MCEKWQVRRALPGDVTIEAFEHFNVEPLHSDLSENEAISYLVSALEDTIWQLELAKYIEAHDKTQICFWLNSALRLKKSKLNAVWLNCPDVELNHCETTLKALLNGEPDAKTNELNKVLSVLFGGLILLGLAFRYLSLNQRQKLAAPLMVGVNGEVSNRTKHILSLIEPNYIGPLLITGQIRKSTKEIKSIFGNYKSELSDIEALYPLDIRAVIGSLLSKFSYLLSQQKNFDKIIIDVPFWEKVKINIRFFQGYAHQLWWGAVLPNVDKVIFGHTGLSDCSLLEKEMQKSETKTCHYVHGVSHGWNFAGVSDFGVFVCGHDAKLGKLLPAYGEAFHIKKHQPDFIEAGEKWALMTSYSHPMNPLYQDQGVSVDIEIIRDVVRGLAQRNISVQEIVWRPHPVIHSLPEPDKAALYRAVAELGLSTWPDKQPYDSLKDFAGIITTPSTVAIDCLNFGKLPIIYAREPLDRESLYRQFTTYVEGDYSFDKCLEEISLKSRKQKLFKQSWEAINPSARPDNLEHVFN